MGPFPKAVNVKEDLDHCRNYDLLDLSIGGGYAPGEAGVAVEEPPVDEPVGRPRGLPGPKASCDPEDALGAKVVDSVIDPPRGADIAGLYRPLRGEDYL